MIIGLDVGGTHTDVVILDSQGLVKEIKVHTDAQDLFNTVLNGLKKITQDIDPKKIKETLINEALINWHSFDGNEALNALRETNGFASHVTDKQLKQMSTYLHKKEGMRILPASCAGLIALLNVHNEQRLINDRFVAVITGKY